MKDAVKKVAKAEVKAHEKRMHGMKKGGMALAASKKMPSMMQKKSGRGR